MTRAVQCTKQSSERSDSRQSLYIQLHIPWGCSRNYKDRQAQGLLMGAVAAALVPAGPASDFAAPEPLPFPLKSK
jgi:hypothetical protein